MNDNNGFIILDRKMLNWGWYQNINTKTLFLHCLFKANWKDGEFQGKKIPRGSFVTSLSKLSEELSSNKQKLTLQVIRTSLKHLVSTNELTIKSTNKYTVITVNNYDNYQDLNKYLNNQLTNKQQTTNKQLTTIENNKTIKHKNNNNIIINIYEFVEQNFGRTLSPIEYEEINTWNDTELTRYAIKQAVLSNKCGTKYISRILSAYERENIRTVQQAQERERQYIEAKKNKTQGTYPKRTKSGMEKFNAALDEWERKMEEQERNDNQRHP